MGIVVQKYGGSSVANAERVFNVAQRIAETYNKGNKVVVVVSAQGKTTDELIRKANEINDKPSRRELDVLLSTGEQMSIALISMAIEKLGYNVVSLTGQQAGIATDSIYGNARVQSINTERIFKELDKNAIVIVAGFQGINQYGDITTLGRGGSDTTAVALAAALRADICEIYSDVDGIYTSDPKIVADASKLNIISYDEMLELASLGAKVLHNRSVELAKKYNVNLVCKSSFSDDEGTYVKEITNLEAIYIRGVTKDINLSRITVLNVKDEPGKAYTLFSLLAKQNICVDIIIQGVGRDGRKDILFTINVADLDTALEVIQENIEAIDCEGVTHSEDYSKVSIVGVGMVNNPGVAARMFEALTEENINIHMISSSEIKVSILINKEESDKAIRAIHRKFKINEFNF